MNISVVNYDLAMGGTDKVAYELSLLFRDHGHDVTFLTVKRPSHDFFQLPHDIKRESLGFEANDESVKGAGYIGVGAIKAFCRLVRFLKTRQPDVVVANWTSINCFVILASFFCRTRVVCIEHIHFDQPSSIWQRFRKWLYRHAYRVVCLTDQDLEKLSAIGSKAVKIYNPLSVKVDCLAERKDGFKFLAVGRLEEQKGFDILIKAFSKVVRYSPRAKLDICGSGSQREALRSLIHQEGLEEHVFLRGPTEDISAAYSDSDYFVLSSRYEGFGLVLVEAQAHGLPVISFDCPNGPSEIIEDRVNGLLVENGSEESLADAMCELIENPEACDRLINNAFSSLQRFSHDTIYEQWEREVF
ncbi:glycosyltransferase family 4 protein [Halomonas salina]|uniref:glycosyltransferase family 4 protein n=1 Tax=Halomonas salina TaxID=42565 RepID=UPI0009DCB20B|nr:glycosyltransferase family 4 protein [Halomonas salina]